MNLRSSALRVGSAPLAVLLVVGCVEKDPDIPARGRRPLTRAEKTRVKRNILTAPPAKLRYRVNADLEGKLVYLGLDAPAGPVVPGKPFIVVHYWQVKQAVPGWKLFVHTNGPKRSDFRNFDHTPVHGLYPVSQWKPGEIVKDRHAIVLPKNTRYPTVDIYVGIWRGGRRLKVRSGKNDGQNRVLAARIPVGHAAGARRARPARKRYLARRATGRITIDGKNDEPDWKAAPSTGLFVSSLEGKPQSPRTEARLLWDDTHLYVFFSADDDDVWAQVEKPDDPKMWTEQVFEVYLDADGNGAEYIELQVNPRGVIFDAYLPRPGQAQLDWQSGMRAKVFVRGTLNKRGDKDQGWQAELAIPLSAARGRSKGAFAVPPRVGQMWRLNLFRTDRSVQGTLKAWAWSPPLRSTFHALDRFGELVFADAQGGTTPAPAAPGGMKPAPPRPGPRRAAPPKNARPRPRKVTGTAGRPMGGMK
jgi:hypothetical protein